jgi:hypothetical protein
MKKRIIKILFLFIFLYTACKEDKISVLTDSILAGQKDGKGTYYFNFEPDINCYLVDPWLKQDTSIYLDLNSDGLNDFIVHRLMSYPGMLGAGGGIVTLIPLNNNEICVTPNEFEDTILVRPCMPSKLDWLDTLSINDSINSNLYWTNNESLLYHYSRIINQCSLSEGYWQNITEIDKKYFGFRIVKENKNYYGWMHLYCDIYNCIITEYAINQEY